MRVWQQIKNVCTRLTVTRVHFFFVLITLVHCAALVFLQSFSFVINEEARDFMVNMMTITGAQRDAIAVVAYRPNHTLFLCQQVPGSGFLRDEEYFGETGCRQISPPSTLVVETTDVVATQAQAPVPYKHSRRSLLYPDQMVLVPDGLAGQLRGLSIVGLGNSSGILDPNGNLWVSKDCVASLRYPEQEFQDAGRENVSFLFFHVWIVVISFLAIINESIPHLASALAGQCLATVWAAWDVWRTSRFQIRYNLLVAKSVCAGAELIPKYWPTRIKLNVSIICINAGALVLTFWLTVVLIKMFLTSQFRSVGAASSLDRLYRILMAFSTILRLYIFFLVLTTTLWLDQLGTGLLHTFLSKTESDAHIGIGSIALILALPLVFVGDISMRIERRALAFAYLVAQFGYIVFHISLVASSSIYRWMLTLWPFLAVNVAAAIILAIISLVLGVICRINFGRGLDHFLHVTSVLEADGFTRAFIAPETEPSKKRSPKGSWDTLVESGETVKVAAAYHRPESIAERPSTSKRSIGTIGRKSKRTRRDSTESFGHTTLDPNASEDTFVSFIDEKSELRERDREMEREVWAARFDQQGRTNMPPVTMTTRGQDSLMAQDTLVVRDSILAQQITTTDSLPVFDNRAAVRAPDGATGPGS